MLRLTDDEIREMEIPELFSAELSQGKEGDYIYSPGDIVDLTARIPNDTLDIAIRFNDTLDIESYMTWSFCWLFHPAIIERMRQEWTDVDPEFWHETADFDEEDELEYYSDQ